MNLVKLRECKYKHGYSEVFSGIKCVYKHKLKGLVFEELFSHFVQVDTQIHLLYTIIILFHTIIILFHTIIVLLHFVM